MKRSALAVVASLAVAVGTVVAATPASALKASVGGKSCSATAYRDATGASAKRGTCSSVRSRTQYRDQGGTLRSVTGSWGSTSSAKGTTTMVVYRGINVSYNGGTTGWYSY